VRKVGGVGDSLAWATRLPPTLIEELEDHVKPHVHKRDWTKPDVDSKKKCGSGIGYCSPGDWCVHGKISQRSILKAD
jgi:hypothetical protein